MTTRSGLSINKPSSNHVSQAPPKEERPSGLVKRRRKKRKSMNDLSFVTRYYLCRKVPDLNFPGITCREYVHFSEIQSPSEMLEFDDTSDENNDTSLDDFILSMAENMNNNHSYNLSDIVVQKEEWLLHNKGLSSDSIESAGCPLAKYFANNRLPELVPGTSSPKDTNQNASCVEYGNTFGDNGIGVDYCRYSAENDCILANNDYDSDDTTSSVSSDNLYPYFLPGIQECVSPASATLTESLKLPDAQQKILFVDDANGQKVIKCRECEKVFTNESAYMSHLRAHVKAKNTCFLCGKVFNRTWLLKGHLRTHTGEKPFICPEKGCSKSFADKSNLRSHTMIHNVGKNDYKCEMCGRTFAQKRYLHKHVQEVCQSLVNRNIKCT